jgi:Amt family ammonium transporter
VLVAGVYTAAVSFGLLRLTDALVGLRVDAEDESRGLDLSLHNETGYNL